jgi:hypothetical protein
MKMFRDAVLLMWFGAVSYLWLCAIASPLVSSGRSLLVRRGDRPAWTALGLAAAGAVLWTAIPVGAILLMRMLEAEAGVSVLRGDIIWRGVTLGNIVWMCQMLTFARVPRIGSAFETATALGIVAIVRDDPWTLSKVERLYRTHALASAPSAEEPVRGSGAVRTVAA